MQLGNTMYNQMLSDMGLNISSAPDKPEPDKPPEAAARPIAQSAVQQPVQQVIQPAVQQVIRPATEPAKPSGSNKTKWLILAGIAALLVFIALIVVILTVLIYLSKFS